MKYEFEIIRCDNKNILNHAVYEYKGDPSQDTLISMVCDVISYYISSTNVEKLILKIEETEGYGNYFNGTLTLNEKLFYNPNHVGSFINLFITVFHEMSHAMVDVRNRRILNTLKNPELFLSTFNDKSVLYIIKKMTNSIEYAQACVALLYLQDKNELYAFRKSIDFTNKFFSEFFPDLLNKVPTYENYVQKRKESVIKTYPYIKNQENNIISMINEYQIDVINRGLNKILPFERDAIVETYPITFSKELRSLLIDECIKTKNPKKVLTYLFNPYFIPTDKEIQKLQMAFDIELLENTILKWKQKSNIKTANK